MTQSPPVPSTPTTATATATACPACEAPMAADQRYCLNCGERRGPARVPPPTRTAETTTPAGAVTVAPAPASLAVAAHTTPSLPVWVAAIGVLLLAMGVGVLIGRSGEDAAQPSTTPVAVVPGTAAGTGAAATAAFASDWPAGEEGWTVALQQFAKDGAQPTQVAQAKTDATGKGAADVGALDTDAHGSLEPGNYLVYAGRFDSKKKAAAALKGLKDAFPDARVVRVADAAEAEKKTSAPGGGADGGGGRSAPAVKDLETTNPQEYQKRSRALPNEVGTEGRPPPKDSKRPGAGSAFEEIG